MSDGRNIQIKIAATGGEQAAAEIKKVETAAESLAGERGGKGLKSLADEASKVSASNVKMGTGMQNVGYQLQDLAVQIGSGTSAFRALGQQLPQLLSGFGPLGITLGTVSAVALPLAGAMFGLGTATADSGEKAEAAAEKWKKLNDARTDKAIAAALKDNAAYIASLDDENAAVTRNNDAIQRTIDLLAAKRRAQAEIDSAQAALDLAKIDADPNMSEADKIKARAKVQEGLERKRYDDRKEEAGFRVNAANNAARGATGESTRATEDAELAKKRLADQEAERAGLKGKINAADSAKGSLPGAERQVSDAQSKYNSAVRLLESGGGGSKEELEALQKKVDQATAERDRLSTAAGGASGADRERLQELQGKDGKGGAIADTKKAVEDLTVAAQKLAEAAAKARADAEAVLERETVGVQGDQAATSRRIEAMKITSDSGAVKAVKKDAKDYLDGQEKADRDASKDERRGLQGDLDGREDKLDATARSRGLNMRNYGLKNDNKTAGDVGKALSDGTDAAEIQKLGDQVKEAAGKNGAAMTAALQKVLAELSGQASEIEKLKGQIRKGRDLK